MKVMQRILESNLEKKSNGFIKRHLEMGGYEYLKTYGHYLVVIHTMFPVSFNGKTKYVSDVLFYHIIDETHMELVLNFTGLRWMEHIEKVVEILDNPGTTAITNDYLNNKEHGYIRIDNFVEKTHTFFAKVVRKSFGVQIELGDEIETRIAWNLAYDVTSKKISDIETINHLVALIFEDKK